MSSEYEGMFHALFCCNVFLCGFFCHCCFCFVGAFVCIVVHGVYKGFAIGVKLTLLPQDNTGHHRKADCRSAGHAAHLFARRKTEEYRPTVLSFIVFVFQFLSPVRSPLPREWAPAWAIRFSITTIESNLKICISFWMRDNNTRSNICTTRLNYWLWFNRISLCR